MSEAHFSLPYFETGYSLVVTRPKDSRDFWAFFGPFGLSLWVRSLFFSCFSFSLVKSFFYSFLPLFFPQTFAVRKAPAEAQQRC